MASFGSSFINKSNKKLAPKAPQRRRPAAAVAAQASQSTPDNEATNQPGQIRTASSDRSALSNNHPTVDTSVRPDHAHTRSDSSAQTFTGAREPHSPVQTRRADQEPPSKRRRVSFDVHNIQSQGLDQETTTQDERNAIAHSTPETSRSAPPTSEPSAELPVTTTEPSNTAEKALSTEREPNPQPIESASEAPSNEPAEIVTHEQTTSLIHNLATPPDSQEQLPEVSDEGGQPITTTRTEAGSAHLDDQNSGPPSAQPLLRHGDSPDTSESSADSPSEPATASENTQSDTQNEPPVDSSTSAASAQAKRGRKTNTDKTPAKKAAAKPKTPKTTTTTPRTKKAAATPRAKKATTTPRKPRNPRKQVASAADTESPADGNEDTTMEGASAATPQAQIEEAEMDRANEDQDEPATADTAEPVKKRGRQREPTPEDAEDMEIDPASTTLFELTKDKRRGKKSQLEKAMQGIDWKEVARKRKEADLAIASGEASTTAGGGDVAARLDAAAASEESTQRGPQLKIVNGQMVIDNASLVVNGGRMAGADMPEGGYEELEESDLTRRINSQSWLYDNKREPTERCRTANKSDPWTEDETAHFYDALRMFGTDFFIISQMFPGRTRRHIKLKFTREERARPADVRAALVREIVPMSLERYCEATGTDADNWKDPRALEAELQAEDERHREELERRRASAAETQRQRSEAEKARAKDGGRRRKKSRAQEEADGDVIVEDIPDDIPV